MKVIRVKRNTKTETLERGSFFKRVDNENKSVYFESNRIKVFAFYQNKANFDELNEKRKEMNLLPIYPGVAYYEPGNQQEKIYFRKFYPIPSLSDINEKARTIFEELDFPENIKELKRNVCQKIEKGFKTIPIVQGNKIFFKANESFEIELKDDQKMILRTKQDEVEFSNLIVEGLKMHLFNEVKDYHPKKTIAL